MPEVLEQPVTESLGWRAGLSDDLKQNEAFVPFKTVSDFGKDYLAVKTKATELEGKLQGAVPKLGDNATDAERNQFYDALGRPKQPSEYEFDGEDKNAPEWTGAWKQEFHKLGFTKAQAKGLSTAFNAQIQRMVEAHNAAIKTEITTAETKLKSELGDKYDANVELAKRMWGKYGEGEFDKAFDQATSASRVPIIRMILKLAALTGEDKSPQGGTSQGGSKQVSFIAYDKSPAPPKR